MKKLPVIVVSLLFLCQAGCQKPSPLTLEPPVESPAGGLVVTVLSSPDTNITVNQVDSVGVLPAVQTTYTGLFLVNSVKYDNGNGVLSTAFASAYFGDRNRPLVINGRIVGYYGIDLMPRDTAPLRVGGFPMTRYPYRVRIGSRDTTFGYVYRATFASLQPRFSFDWDDPEPDDGLSPFRDSVRTPEALSVQAPVGGSVLSRAKGVELRWIGNGPITIVVSARSVLTGRTRPILQLQPVVNTGRAVVDPQLLQLLPQGRNFVFTFIIANRFDRRLGEDSKDRILVQAASVYNSYVQLQ